MTPLHQACESKQIKVVQQILTFMACSSLDTVREALLPYCRRMCKQLPASVCEGIRMAVDMINAKGQTPLMYACFSDCPELVKLLLSHGADPWVGDRCGRRTALHYAAMGGSSACIQALMKHIPPRLLARHGVRYVDARSLCGLTPLHYCIYFGNLEALRELLHHFDPAINAATTSESYDVGVTCEARSSPLHFAAVTGNEQAARELLSYYYQRRDSGPSAADPRGRINAAGQMPWQVAFTHHPGALSLASLLHPGQPLERVLGAASAHGSGAGGGALSQLGPAPLVAIAGAALRAKLVAELQELRDQEETERGQRGQGCQEKQERMDKQQERQAGGQDEAEAAIGAGVTGTAQPAAVSGVELCTSTTMVPQPMSSPASCGGGGCTTTATTAATSCGARDGDDSTAATNSSTTSSTSSSRCRAVRSGSGRGRRSATVAPLPASHAARQPLELPLAATSAASAGATAAAGTVSGVGAPLSVTCTADASSCGSLGFRSGSGDPAASASSRCSMLQGESVASSSCGGGGACPAAAAEEEPQVAKRQAGGHGDEGGCGAAAAAAKAADEEDEDEDLQCEVCFAARVAVAPAGCRHGLCGDCAEQLCQGVARRPLHCPFCRGVVTGFVKFAPQRA
ncbi:hypothetical protein PLESTF_000709500 [Pleodorina starrii]|nr:hypothetical protein PLESTF_000709500 [Pleodorina starrii]